MFAVDVFHLVAYIDAGTGSYLLAAIASGAAGLWMFFRSGMVKLRRKVRGDRAHEVDSSDNVSEESMSREDESEEPVARG
jgi:hypothetical protein